MKTRWNTPRLEHLQLDRPLIVFDLETTGTDPTSDRIVQIALVRFEDTVTPPRRKRPKSFVRVVNPGCPIPSAASAVHGVNDADVADAPPFAQFAPWLAKEFESADIAGFNVRKFDLPLLIHEMRRADVDLDLSNSRVVDAFEIFTLYQPRTLSAAYSTYCGKDHADAHDALGDVLATAEILDAQVASHEDLPSDSAGIAAQFQKPDLMGRLTDIDGKLALAFGKHRGRTLEELAAQEPDYLRWMLSADFLPDVQQAVRSALENNG